MEEEVLSPCKYQGDGNGLVGILMSTYNSIAACCGRRADGTNSNPSGTCIGQGKVLYTMYYLLLQVQ